MKKDTKQLRPAVFFDDAHLSFLGSTMHEYHDHDHAYDQADSLRKLKWQIPTYALTKSNKNYLMPFPILS